MWSFTVDLRRHITPECVSLTTTETIMQRVTFSEQDLGKRWGVSVKTLQRWRSEGRGPKFMKLSKRVLYPIEEIYMYESVAMRAATWESASDVVHPDRTNFLDARQIASATGLPLYVFTHLRVRESLGVPHRRISKQIRFDLDEVMAWAKRWSQDMQNLGIDTRDPATEHRTLQQAIASLAD
jgi:hypothetical protein